MKSFLLVINLWIKMLPSIIINTLPSTKWLESSDQDFTIWSAGVKWHRRKWRLKFWLFLKLLLVPWIQSRAPRVLYWSLHLHGCEREVTPWLPGSRKISTCAFGQKKLFILTVFGNDHHRYKHHCMVMPFSWKPCGIIILRAIGLYSTRAWSHRID